MDESSFELSRPKAWKSSKSTKSFEAFRENHTFFIKIDAKPQNLLFARKSTALDTSEKRKKFGAIVIITARRVFDATSWVL